MRKICNVVLSTLIVLTLTGCAGPNGQERDRLMALDDRLIVPGVRVGPIFLGMTEAELYKKIGNPSHTFHGEEDNWYSFRALHLDVSVNLQTHVVDTIGTGSSSYATAKGLTIGSSPLQLKAELGAEYDGVCVHFDTNGDIANFQVTWPYSTGRGTCSLSYDGSSEVWGRGRSS